MKRLFYLGLVYICCPLTPLYVCDGCDVGLWESLHRQTVSNGSHVGNQQSAGWSKGNPLFREGFTLFISSWATANVLKMIFKLKVSKFSIRINIQINLVIKLNYLRSSNQLDIFHRSPHLLWCFQ